MKVLNRQSELYQHLYNDALMRLARVPNLINLKAVKGYDFVNYHADVVGYIFNRDELQLPTPDNYANYADLGEYVTGRLREALMRSYGSNGRAGILVPFTVGWPTTILSVLGEMRRGVTATHDYIDIEQTAHYAVMRFVYQTNRTVSRSGPVARIKEERLTLDQAMMEVLAGRKPEVAKPVAGMELTAGVVGGNPLCWGMQSNYNASESVVSVLNNLSVEEWQKLIDKLVGEDKRLNATFHLNAPWAVKRLPVEGEAFIDAYGIPAISTHFGNMVDDYYRTDESMTVEEAIEVVRRFTDENQTDLPLVKIFRNARDGFRSKWLALPAIDPLDLRVIAQEEFDESFELIRAARVMREYIVD